MKLSLASLSLCSALIASSAPAAYVTPGFAGGQLTGSMIMPAVLFDGSSVSVTGVYDMMGMPVSTVPSLVGLTAPAEFDPAKPWAVLNGTAFNFQYGWNIDANSDFLPANASIWIEKTAGTPGLLTYEHDVYTPIFGTAGSNTKWQWNGSMAHNAYAVPAGVGGNWSATYHLYVGNSAGTPINGYGDTTLTLNWTSVPEPASLAVVGLSAVAALRRRRR